MRATSTVLAGFVFSTAVLSLWGQEQPPKSTLTLKADRRIVVIDVVVTDRKGNPMHGLKPSDFQVLEQGKAQLIEHLEEEDSTRAAAAPPSDAIKMPAGVYTNILSAPPTGPLNIVLFDTANTPAQSQLILKDQLKSFVKTLKTNDRVAIFGLDSRLHLLQGFTSDPVIIKSALLGKKDFMHADAARVAGQRDDHGLIASDSIDPNDPDPAVSETFFEARRFEANTAVLEQESAARATLSGLNQLARYLAGIPGRKNLIWFSAAFPAYILPNDAPPNSAEVIPGGPDLSTINADYLYETIGLLSRAQVAVYPIDPRGTEVDTVYTAQTPNRSLISRPDFNSTLSANIAGQNSMEHLTMSRIAESTGGKAFFNINDLSGSAQKAFEAGANYYTITYTPANNDWHGEYRSLKVTTPVQGAHLSYRTGYYATIGGSYGKREALARQKAAPDTIALINALARGTPPSTQITLNVRITPGKNGEPPQAAPGSSKKQPWKHYTLDYAVDASTVTFEAGEGNSHNGTVEFICMVYDGDGKLLNVGRTAAKLNLNQKQYAAAVVGGLRTEQDIVAPPNSYFRIAVHDRASNKVGSLEVPGAAIPAPNPSTPKT